MGIKVTNVPYFGGITSLQRLAIFQAAQVASAARMLHIFQLIASALDTLRPRENAYVRVEYEFIRNGAPRCVSGERVVELFCERVQARQAGPGHGGKVMVLVVVADVVSERVERAVIGPGLLVELVEEVVLGDEVAGAGVQRAGEEGREDEVP